VYTGNPDAYMHLRQCNILPLSAKTSVAVLNDLYYESAVYTNLETQPGESFLVSLAVDGVTVYGRGSTLKEAKSSAACVALEQLRCLGILQQRMASKAMCKADRKSAASGAEKPPSYRSTVCAVVPENAKAKLNRLSPGLAYNVVASSCDAATGYSAFTVSVTVDGKQHVGTGRSKKLASMGAAEAALRALGQWTADDDAAKKAQRVAAAASGAVRVSGKPGRGFRGGTSARATRGGPAVRGQRPFGGAGRGRGSAFAVRGGSPPFAVRGGTAIRGRGPDTLRRGTRGGRPAAHGGAASGPVQIPRDKNPVMLLNEVYYSAAVYEFAAGDEVANGASCSLSVDGVTTHGAGPTRKDAKLSAAAAAVQRLEASGPLQKRLTDKAAFLAKKQADHEQRMAGMRPPGRGLLRGGQPSSGRGRPAARPPARGRGVPSYYAQNYVSFETGDDVGNVGGYPPQHVKTGGEPDWSW